MATTVTVTVSDTGTPDYSTLVAAEAGEQRNLVSADEVCDILCESFTDTAASRLEIVGWTTDATRYIKVRGEDVPGLSSGGYRFIRTGNNNALKISTDYTRLEQFFVDAQGTTGADDAIEIADPYCKMTGMIAKANLEGGTSAFYLNSTNVEMTNCLGIGGDSCLQIDNSDAVIYNCTFKTTGASGIAGNANADNLTIKNCVAYGATTDWDLHADSTITAASNNAGATGVIVGLTSTDGQDVGTDAVTITSADFVDYAGDRFRPADGGNLDSAGADLSGTFTTDIAGNHRRFWSIGAFDYWAMYARIKSSAVEPDEYSSLSVAEAAEQRDLTIFETVMLFEGEAFADSTHAIFDGWVTGEDEYIEIRAAAGHEHLGVDGDGYRLTGRLTLYVAHARCVDLAVYNVGNTAATLAYDDPSGSASASLELDRCYMTGGGRCEVFMYPSTSGTLLCINSVFAGNVDGTGGASGFFTEGTSVVNVTMQNCMFFHGNSNGPFGRQAGGALWPHNFTDVLLENCLFWNVNSGWYSVYAPVGSISASCRNNGSKNGDLEYNDGLADVTLVSGDFFDLDNGDYRTKIGGGAEDEGVDLSAQFTVDITKATR